MWLGGCAWPLWASEPTHPGGEFGFQQNLEVLLKDLQGGFRKAPDVARMQFWEHLEDQQPRSVT